MPTIIREGLSSNLDVRQGNIFERECLALGKELGSDESIVQILEIKVSFYD